MSQREGAAAEVTSGSGRSRESTSYGAPRYASSASVPLGSRHHRLANTPRSRNQQQQQQPPQEPRVPQPPLLAGTIAEIIATIPPPTLWPSILLQIFIFDPLASLFASALALVLSPRTHRLVLRLGVLGALFWTALSLAVIAYVGFYRAWVPDIGVHRRIWLQYGHDVPPFANVALTTSDGARSIFAEDQAYDVHLDLVVPLSAANIDLGNFMVELDLRTGLNQTVVYASKPAMIVHEPAPVRAMNHFVYALTRDRSSLKLPTSTPPVQLLTINLLDRAILQPAPTTYPFAPHGHALAVTNAHLSVGRHDSLKYWVYGGGHGVGGVDILESGKSIINAASAAQGFRSRGELQTYGASLRFDAHLTGLRYFMYHHPLASFLIFVTLFMTFEMVSALTLWVIAAVYTSSSMVGLGGDGLAVEDNFRGMRQYTTTSGEDDDRTGEGTTTEREFTAGQTEEERRADEEDEDGDTETETEVRQRSRQSLDARDREERREARRAAVLRDEQQGRRMTAVGGGEGDDDDESDLPDDEEMGEAEDQLGLPLEQMPTQTRRVLGRLDEETEEETDFGAGSSVGRRSAFEEEEFDDDGLSVRDWEDIQGDEAREEGRQRAGGISGLRRRKGTESVGPESTIGGSSTSRASSAARSFGATTSASRASSVTTAGPSGSTFRQGQPQPQIKEEDEDEDGAEEEVKESRTPVSNEPQERGMEPSTSDEADEESEGQ